MFLVTLISLRGMAAEQGPGLRKCMLLPIHDNMGGGLGYQVYQELEDDLKDSEWCYYQTNSVILNILKNYKKNLQEHLENPAVLSTLSEVGGAGTLIKVDVTPLGKGVDLMIRVYEGSRGDILFKEKTRLENQETTIIVQHVKNWLSVYEKSIPYDARITGVLGTQFTVDMGREYGILSGSELRVVRPTQRRRHPLLKEIVEWKTELIGVAKIRHVSKSQSQAKMLLYEGKHRIKEGDWVIIDRSKKNESKLEKNYLKGKDDYSFGKIGRLGLFVELGSGSSNILDSSSVSKKIGGNIFGVDILGELWITRNMWTSLEIQRKFSSFSKKEGSLQNSSNSLSISHMKILGGYKYLPLSFYYGPQVDAYMGYARFSYGLDTQISDGFTTAVFKGFLLGMKGDMPLIKNLRVGLGLDFLFGAKYNEEVVIYGKADSVSSYHIYMNSSYKWSQAMTIDTSFGVQSNKAVFKSPEREFGFKESYLKFGSTFTF